MAAQRPDLDVPGALGEAEAVEQYHGVAGMAAGPVVAYREVNTVASGDVELMWSGLGGFLLDQFCGNALGDNTFDGYSHDAFPCFLLRCAQRSAQICDQFWVFDPARLAIGGQRDPGLRGGGVLVENEVRRDTAVTGRALIVHSDQAAEEVATLRR